MGRELMTNYYARWRNVNIQVSQSLQRVRENESATWDGWLRSAVFRIKIAQGKMWAWWECRKGDERRWHQSSAGTTDDSVKPVRHPPVRRLPEARA